MTSLYGWLAAGVLLAASYLEATKLSLLRLSRGSIQQAMADRGRPEAGRWLARRFNAVVFGVALLRTTARLGFFVLVLAQVVGLSTQASIVWADLLLALLISVPLVWLFTGVVAVAVARHAAPGLVSVSVPLLRVIALACYPFTRAVSFIDEAVRRLAGANLHEGDQEVELLRSIEESEREGELDKDAACMLENVVEFTSTDVAEIMTPRTDIEGIELTDDLAVIRSFISKVGHSRIPVYKGNLDHVVGVLYVRDLVPYLGEDADDFRLEPLLRQPIIVPETKPVSELLTDFQRSKVHMAIVIDEYGGTEGLVTIEDVLEEIVGEIRDEHEHADEAEPCLTSIDDRHVEVDGRYHIDDLNELLGLKLPEHDDFDTIGGFVLASLGHVPRAGESFEAHNARFTALAAAPTHVQRVGIELLQDGHAPVGSAVRTIDAPDGKTTE